MVALGNKVPEYSLSEKVIPLPDLGNLPSSLALGTIGMPGYVFVWAFIWWSMFFFFLYFWKKQSVDFDASTFFSSFS